MTLEQAFLAAVAALSTVVLALWRKSTLSEERYQEDIRKLNDKIIELWNGLHKESMMTTKEIIQSISENSNLLRQLHGMVERLDMLRYIDEATVEMQKHSEREKTGPIDTAGLQK